MEVVFMSFNYTYANPSITSMSDLSAYMNTVTGDVGWTVFSVTSYVFLTLLFSKMLGMKNGMFWSGLISAVMSVFLIIDGLVKDYLVLLYAFSTAGILLINYIQGRGG